MANLPLVQLTLQALVVGDSLPQTKKNREGDLGVGCFERSWDALGCSGELWGALKHAPGNSDVNAGSILPICIEAICLELR